MELSNIRIERIGAMSRLTVDVNSQFYSQTQLWVEVPSDYKEWLSRDVYDSFVIAVLYPCMKHKDSIVIRGGISPRLHRNLLNYVIPCMTAFSKDLSPIKIVAAKYSIPEKRYNYVGAGFSGGVDSFSSIYDRFEKEENSQYKISALLCFNAGSHGDYDDPQTLLKFWKRYEFLCSFPREVGLPYIPVNTNIHEFMDEGHQQSGITRHIACPMALQAAFSRYYYASTLSYFEEKYWGREQFDFDLSEFCEPHLLAWISTESIELISEGGQYFRTEKIGNIVNYSYAQKYLNVCVNASVDNAMNCSYCSKCKRTLVALDSMGENVLNQFSDVFDIGVWKKNRFAYLCELKLLYGREPYATDNLNFLLRNNKKVPTYLTALIVCRGRKLFQKVRRLGGRIKRRFLYYFS